MNKIISITFVGGIIIPLSRVLIFPNQTLIFNLDFVQFHEGGDYGCSKFLRIFLVKIIIIKRAYSGRHCD